MSRIRRSFPARNYTKYRSPVAALLRRADIRALERPAHEPTVGYRSELRDSEYAIELHLLSNAILLSKQSRFWL
jgi:hypothetical protein